MSFDIPDDVLAELRRRVGTTDADFGRMLARNMAVLASPGGPVPSMAELIWLEIDRAAASIQTSLSGRLIAPDFSVQFSAQHVFAENLTHGQVFQADVYRDGSFIIPQLPAGEYALSVDGSVLLSDAGLRISENESASMDLRVFAGNQLSGRIIDKSTGTPQNAEVSVSRIGNEFSTVVNTNSDGEYFARILPDGSYELQIKSDGYGEVVVYAPELLAGEQRNLEIELQVEGRFTGTLRNINSGFPVASVRGLFVPVNHIGVPRAFTTDDLGKFEVGSLHPGKYDVQLSSDLLSLVEPLQVTAVSGQTVNVPISIVSAGAITGTIVLPTMETVDGIRVSLLSADKVLLRAAQLGEGNSFSFMGVSRGDYFVAIQVEGVVLKTIEVEYSADASLELGALALPVLAKVSGQVNGLQSESGVLVELGSGEPVLDTSTEENGRFAIGLLDDGEYVVRVLNDQAIFAPQTVTVSNGIPTPGTLIFTPGNLSMAGTVRLADGQAASDARVYARSLQNGEVVADSVFKLSNSDGTFVIDGLTVGAYRLFAFLNGRGYAAIDVAVSNNVSGLDLSLREGRSLHVTVDTPFGISPEGTEVILYDLTNAGIAGYGTADADGLVSLADLPSGNYELLIRQPGARLHRETISIGTQDRSRTIALALAETVVAGAVTTEDGLPVRGAYVLARDSSGTILASTFTDADGRFRIDTLPAISIFVTVEANGATSVQTGQLDLFAQAVVDSLALSVNGDAISFRRVPETLSGALASRLGDGSVWDNYWTSISDLDALREDIRLSEKPDCLSQEAERLYRRAQAAVNAMEGYYAGMEDKLGQLHSAVHRGAGRLAWDAAKVAVDVAGLITPIGHLAGLFIRNVDHPFFDGLFTTIGSLNILEANVSGVIAIRDDGLNYALHPAGGIAVVNGWINLASQAINDIAAVQRQVPSLLSYLRNVVTVEQFNKIASGVGRLTGIYATIADIYSLLSNMAGHWETIVKANDDFNHSMQVFELWKQKAKKLIAEYEAAADSGDVRADAIDDEFEACEGDSVSGNVLGNDIPLKCVEGSIFVTSSRPDLISRNGSFTFDGASPGTHTISYSIGVMDKQGREIIVDNAIVRITIHEKKDCPPPPDPCADPGGYNDWLKECPCGEKDGGGATADCSSRDPNDIIGPYGPGTERWVRNGDRMDYMIRFENDPEVASAPAAVVAISQVLDSDLDLNTFRLGLISFGNIVISDANGRSAFSTRLDLVESHGIFLDVNAGINTETGEIWFRMASIDPQTGEVPFSPFVGFLPPNIDGAEGQGFVTYSIRPKGESASGTRIDAVADIFFDQNEVIVTPAIFNTIDSDAPSSSVVALNSTSFPGVLVKWTGSDANGSGVDFYDIYVSQNGGTFELWLSQTTRTEAWFLDAEIGSTYQFYSVAYDAVRNVELAPAVADTTTLIVEPPVTSVTGVQVSSTDGVSVTIAFADDVVVADAITDGSIRDAVSLVNYQSGSLDLTDWVFTYSTTTHELQLSTTATLPSGVYEVLLDGEKFLTASGAILRGGHTGFTFGVPEFAAETQIQANSVPIVVAAHSSPVLFDWNNDGRVDLIVGETLSTGNGQIRVYLNTGTTTNPVFGNSIIAQTNTGDLLIPVTGTGGITPRLADLSGDGDEDLIVGLPNGQIQYWLNVGTRTQPIFALPQVLQAGVAGSKTDISVGSAATVDVIDWDNNGTLDLVTGSLDGRVRVFLNSATSGSLDFGAAFVIQNGTGDLVVPTGRSSVSVVDLNYDGRKDLVLGNADGQALLYRNIGSDAQPRFDGFVPLTAGGAEINLAGFVRSQPYVADLNGDGRPDLVLGATDGKVRLFSSLDSTVPEVIPTIAGGEYSHAFELTLDSAAKTVPVLTGPIGSDITNPPLITWLPAIDAVSYHLFLRNLDNGTVTSLLNLTDIQFRPAQLLSDGLYRVWVRASRSDGFYTDWSTPLEFQIGIPRPVAPVLASPGTGSLGNRPTITWNSVPNATTYDLWVDNVSAGQGQIIRQESLTATSFTPVIDLPQGRYRAWVRAVNSTGISSWSSLVNFLVGAPEPAQAVITPPANLRTTVRPVIQWSATDRASSFELWFDNLTTGEKAAVHVFDIRETSYSQSADLTEGVYRVWVRASNLTGRGQWSSPITIAVGNVAPERSTLTGPVGLTSSVRPTISWTTSAGAEAYLLWVNDLTRGQAKVILRNVTSTSFVPDADLPTGEYRAWIQSQSEFGDGVWSRAFDFAVGPIKPTKAEIITPSGLRTSSTPTLSWKPAAYAQTYEIWIDNRTTGAREFIHQTGLTGTQFTPAVGLADGIYRAWVRAGNTYGFGVWSSYIDFAVGSIAPDQVRIIRPTQAFQNPQPTLIWNIAAGADSYEVWINDLTRGIGEAIHTTVAGNAFTPSSNLANGRYRVWIRAISSHGNGLWSTAVDFDVAVAGSLEDSLEDSLIDSLFEVDMVLTFLHDADLRSEDVEKRRDESHGEQIETDVPANSSTDNDAASISAIVASTEMQLEGQQTASHGTELLVLK